MSKQRTLKWKIAIGVVIAAVVVSGIGLLGLGSVIYRSSGGEHGWSPVAYISELVWGPGASEYIPNPGWGPAAYRGEAEVTTQLQCPELVEGEVRLVDDDGDGVPDRGVIGLPEDLQPNVRCCWGYGPSILRPFDGAQDRLGSRPAMPFGPSTGLRTGFAQDKLRRGPHFSRDFGPCFGRGLRPFPIIGGLFRLAFLALLIGLAVACFYRWSRAKRAREPQ